MIPQHYSRDIAARCQALISQLYTRVADGLPDDDHFGGPLSTTFLLAMATPMIVLPIEWIFKPSIGDTAGDDRKLDEGLAGLMADALGPGKTFGETPFAAANCWSYVDGYPLFNIANTWPHALLQKLAAPEAFENARKAFARRILLDLRNALAHGGVTYLDENGRNTGGPAAMLAFAGMKMDNRKVVGLNVLRVREDDFRAFLAAWADWLERPGVADVLNSKSSVAA